MSPKTNKAHPFRSNLPAAASEKPMRKASDAKEPHSRLQVDARCRVCHKSRCPLRSHTLYHGTIAERRTQKAPPDYKHIEWVAFTKSYAFTREKPSIPISLDTAWVDPFRQLEIDDRSRRFLDISIWTLIGLLVNYIMPFKVKEQMPGAITTPWIELMLQSELSCLATIASWTAMEVSKVENVPTQMLKLSAEFEGRLARVLQNCLRDADFVDDSMILAAAQMVTTVAMHSPSPARLRNLSNGALSLVTSRGGISTFFKTPEQLGRIIRSEWVASLVNADNCFYKDAFPRPKLSLRLEREMLFLPHLTHDFTRYCTKDILQAVDDTRLLLANRSTKEEERFCTMEDYRVLCALLLYTDIEQASLQADYVNAGSLQEAIVLVLILIRLQYISVSDTQPYMDHIISARLKSALNKHDWMGQAKTDHLNCLLWLYTMGAITAREMAVEQLFLGLLKAALPHKYQGRSLSEWPTYWQDELHTTFETGFPWHKRFNKRFVEIFSNSALFGP